MSISGRTNTKHEPVPDDLRAPTASENRDPREYVIGDMRAVKSMRRHENSPPWAMKISAIR